MEGTARQEQGGGSRTVRVFVFYPSYTAAEQASRTRCVRSTWYRSLVSALLGDEDVDLLFTCLPLSKLDMVIHRWWRRANADAGIRDYVLSSRYAGDPSKLQGPSNLPKFPTFREDAVPLASRAAFPCLPDGILAALCPMISLVVAVLQRHPDAPTCGLLMLAAGLGYGREAPGDHACSPMRLHQMSVGSCP